MAYNDRLNLALRARVRADQDGTTFPSDTAYNQYLDEAGRTVWWDLVTAGWPVDFSSTTFVANGASTYAITTGAAVIGVRSVWNIQGGQFTELHRLNAGKEAALRSAQGLSNIAAFYELRASITLGTVVELLPLQSSGTYRVDYIPDFPGFALDTTVWQGPARSDEMLVLLAAAKGLLKEGDKSGAAELQEEFKAVRQQVMDAATQLDMKNPAQIRDVMTTSQRGMFDYQVAGPGWSD